MSEPEEPHIIGGPEQGCFVAELAEMSRERRSWRRRLEWVRDAVQDGAGRSPDRLASLAVFLKLVATGTVPGQEDGGHYRPNHHAQLALEIESALLPADADPELRPLVRSILRWLPSHDGDFRRAEPLTRIRDLAHRNDIPHELKDEIKRTLQNKLHRSAGPEDLVTSARLLERISAPDSGLPADFVTQFQNFHTELQTFFNAGDVRQDLLAIGPALSDDAELIRLFFAVHDQGLDSAERIDKELSLITRLRLHLGPAYAKVDAAHAQRMRQADLKLDERGFVLLSERANRLERGDDAPDLALLALSMAQAARQLALSGAQERPLLVMAESLEKLAHDFAPKDRDQLLRARARCDALRIVLGRYADRVLASYARCARELGPKLGIARESADQFAEAEVRASLAFQLSRLVEQALGFTAAALGLSPWQVIVPGTAEGRLQTGQRVEQLDLAVPTLALLDVLDGDEEIPSAVRGVFALHELPFLSHVAIRARAAGVVLATARDRAARADFEKHVGSQVLVIAGADRLRLEAATGQGSAAPRSATQAAPVTLSEPTLHDISMAQLETAGAKATGARRLCELSDRLGFKAPRARFVPFGAMEACLELAGHGRDAVERWQRGESDEGVVREPIMALDLPDGFEAELLAAFADERSLALRSSSNAEDLSGASGAGLFDSVIGVAPAEVPSALRAVWASLFGRRAQAARKARPQDQVWRMATLIQPVVPADLSFIMYTRSPFDAREIYVELAAGLGETLASAVGEGSPFRVHVQREGTQVRLAAYSSYLEAKVMEDSGRVVQTLVNPAQVRFGEDRAWREAVMMRLRKIAMALEGELGGPQDVEGALLGDDVWLVQSRPSQ